MIDADLVLRLARGQERVFRCIEDELRRDGHHKSYEGAMEIAFSLPSLFARDETAKWSISLHCYVLPINGRHHTVIGKTLADAVAVMEAYIDDICKPYELKRFTDSLECVDDPDEADGSAEIFGDTRDADGR